MRNYTILLFNLLLIIGSNSAKGKEYRYVKKDTPLYLYYKSKKDKRLKIYLKSGSKIEIINPYKYKNKQEIKIVYEPSKADRRDRTGETGWISLEENGDNFRKPITKDELFETVKLTDKIKKASKGPVLKKPCTTCDLAYEKQRKEEIKRTRKNPKFKKGCEDLQKIGTVSEKYISKKNLQTCIDSIIRYAKKKSYVSGHFRGIGKSKLRKVSRKKFYSALAKNLHPLEEDFIGHILTASGEADELVKLKRLNKKPPPPHYQEMMAINLVLENRKRSAISAAKDYEQEVKAIRKRFSLPKNVSTSRLIQEIKKEKKRLEDQSTRLGRKEAKVKMPKIRKEIKRLRTLASKLKVLSRAKIKTSILDIALDESQFSIYLDTGVNKRAKPHEPNYPHWFKVISKDYKDARGKALTAFLKFQKNKSKMPKNAKYYYAHTRSKIKPPGWVHDKATKPVALRFKEGNKILRLNSDPIFSNRKRKNSTYKCGTKRPSQFQKKRAGHCFFSGNWNYFGHSFGG